MTQKGKYKIGMISLGCPKNQVDAEQMLYRLREAGFEITANESKADAVIVNTCGFIEEAKQESIDNILEVARFKEEGTLKAVIVTGCLAERYGEQIQQELPEADVVVGIGASRDIVELVTDALAGKKECRMAPKSCLDMEGDRILAGPSYTAYLRIADGCDNCCSYCAIPLIRGRFRSRRIEDIVAQANQLAKHGTKELVVIAQDTSRYGLDLYGEYRLAPLLQELCQVDGIRWIRVLYAYPDAVNDELLQVMAEEEKIVPYLDLPLQHCSGKVLKDMNRRGDQESLSALLNKIRKAIPNIAIRTTFITGFPGETEEDFKQLAEFVKEQKFARMGCFAYSPEENTKAAAMPNQVKDAIKRHRQELLMTEQSRVMEEWNQSLVGTRQTVLAEGYDRLVKQWFGRTVYDAPDIDGKVFFTSKTPLKPGEFLTVEIEGYLDYDLLGSRVE